MEPEEGVSRDDHKSMIVELLQDTSTLLRALLAPPLKTVLTDDRKT
jgi:hypothetical protein